MNALVNITLKFLVKVNLLKLMGFRKELKCRLGKDILVDFIAVLLIWEVSVFQ